MSKAITHEPIQKIRERRKHISHKLTREQKAEIVTGVCDRIARGEHLTAIGEEEDMPHSNTIRNWIDADPELRKAYRRAQVIRSEIVSESVLTIADEPPPTYRDANGQERVDTGGVQLRRLRIMARQWFATAHLRRWQAEDKAEANAEAESKTEAAAAAATATKSNPDSILDPDAAILAPLPRPKIPTADEISFLMLWHSTPKEYQAVVRQSQIEGCTPRELWDRTKHTHHHDLTTDTWVPAPPRISPRAQPITPP